MSSGHPKIRVLRVITWLPPGGIERKIVEVLPRLNRDRFDVSLACLREPGPLADELKAAGIPVHCITFRKRWDFRAIRRLADLMRREKIELVHSHMYRSNVPATVAAKLAGVKHVWAQIHNVDTWETPRQRMMDRFLCRWREGIIAVSDQVRRDVMDQLGVAREKIRVVYNGVDLSRFGRNSEKGKQCREELRRAEGIGEQDVVFLWAARMVEQKRPQDFIELAKYLTTKDWRGKSPPPLHFWMLGDGSLSDEVKRKAEEFAPRGTVKFFGHRNDVERFMAAGDIFIMTSTKEGFSNALLEAMASGLVPVVTDVGGNAEAVRECQDGRVIPALQINKLFSAVDRILMDAKYRQELAGSSERRARDFSLETMITNVESLYEESITAKTQR